MMLNLGKFQCSIEKVVQLFPSCLHEIRKRLGSYEHSFLRNVLYILFQGGKSTL